MNIQHRTRQTGLSIVELMISITIGLLILAGLTTILVNNSRARTEIERANRQIENGRYALQLLSDDLKLAGYYAEFSGMAFDPAATGLIMLNGLPDPCQTNLDNLRGALPLHVQGYDNASTIPSCLSDVKSNTDILVIRRASTCEAGVADCAAAANDGTPYFQASLCSGATELDAAITNNASYLGSYYQLDTTLANLTNTATALHRRDCTTTPPGTVAAIHRYRTHIYFIANNNNTGDGIPTLKRAELGPGPAFATIALVDGIENLQIQYGIDSPVVNGVPDSYMAAPGSVANWGAAVTAKINLLARNTEITAGYSTTKTYTLGYDASGALITVSFTDSYKRHAYQSQVRLNNPAGRRGL